MSSKSNMFVLVQNVIRHNKAGLYFSYNPIFLLLYFVPTGKYTTMLGICRKVGTTNFTFKTGLHETVYNVHEHIAPSTGYKLEFII